MMRWNKCLSNSSHPPQYSRSENTSSHTTHTHHNTFCEGYFVATISYFTHTQTHTDTVFALCCFSSPSVSLSLSSIYHMDMSVYLISFLLLHQKLHQNFEKKIMNRFSIIIIFIYSCLILFWFSFFRCFLTCDALFLENNVCLIWGKIGEWSREREDNVDFSAWPFQQYSLNFCSLQLSPPPFFPILKEGFGYLYPKSRQSKKAWAFP